MDRRLFIDEQASLDLTYGCLAEACSWEHLNEAVKRAEACWLLPGLRMQRAKYGGLRFA